ncbi:MAG TPA: dipeptidase [Solirubrobacteraceae bacterium]|nr:dipeptidase [Solirubrobacteraceae bacterium]
MPPVFDGHNDALTAAEAVAIAGGREDGHLDVARAAAGGLAGGIFAVFCESEDDAFGDVVFGPDGYDIPLPAPLPHEDALSSATRTAARLFTLEAMGAVRVVRSTADLDRSLEDGRLAAVLGLEGAEPIGRDLSGLDDWYEAGVRVIGPVWSRPNDFAHGVPFRFPSSPDTGPGLTAAGERLVRACNALGIVVDLSHLNENGFWDVARISSAPLVASHSGAHALCPSSRNLTDEQLRAIATTGGLVGVVFAVPFLRADGADDTDTPLRVLVEHVRHVAEVAGIDHVALGSDFDGAPVPAELGDVTGLPRLLDALAADGFTEPEIEAIAWGNWHRVLGASWRD